LSSGVDTSCAIGTDGKITCWGDDPALLEPPPGMFQQLSCGDRLCCALNDARRLQCWGTINFPPNSITRQDLDQVAIDSFGCVIGSGHVRCWGGETFGLSNPPELNKIRPPRRRPRR
jgi:hypothetical protein